MKKTKVFISCGQRDKTTELETAGRVAKLLSKKGYQPYVAKTVQSLGGLTGEIYNQIETSEYFLFIDFKRESLNDAIATKYRGSLFSHQELAIASYLGKKCLTFQQQGVKLEGIQSFIISNPHNFTNTEELMNKIDKEVNTRWRSGWKDELEIIEANPVYQDAIMRGGAKDGENSRWYHASVRNNHYSTHATNCYAYIMDVQCGLGQNISVRNVETHWSGYPMSNMTILPKDIRDVDVFFYFPNDSDNVLYFNPFTTSGHYHPIPLKYNTEKDNVYIFTLKIVSDNFPSSSDKFQLDIQENGKTMSFSKV